MFPFITSTFSFIGGLFSILYRVPAAITIIKAIMDIVGSDAVKQILETIRGVVQSEPNTFPNTEPEQKRFLQRIKDRLALRLLGLKDNQGETMQALRTLTNRDIA